MPQSWVYNYAIEAMVICTIKLNVLIIAIREKMNVILATAAVISCFFIATNAQNCFNPSVSLQSCLFRYVSSIFETPTDDFCNECANSLLSYYQECTIDGQGDNIMLIKQGKLKLTRTESFHAQLMMHALTSYDNILLSSESIDREYSILESLTY